MIPIQINWISVLLVALFLLPLINGLLRPLTDSRIFNSLSAVLGAGEFVFSAGLSLLITQAVFDGAGEAEADAVLRHVPFLQEAVERQDVLAYALVLLLLTIISGGILHLLMLPILKHLMIPLSSYIARWLSEARRVVHRLVSALWEIPRAVGLVLLLSLLLNFYVTLSGNAALCDYISASGAYKLVENGAIKPIVASAPARAIPPLVESTVDKFVQCLSPEGRRLLIRVYINGMTVEEAVKSIPDIDNTAVDLVDAETDDYKKAQIIYRWVCAQIGYDKDKAAQITVDAFAVTSGAAAAFAEKSGVCFDKACLFVSMCRAVDVPVRLITGQGFNGTVWEDHSWNQIYDEKTDRWVNVDTTFGGPGVNYFDNEGFWDDHRYEEIQGEWRD